MKKIVSIILSIAMLLSVTAGLSINAFAADTLTTGDITDTFNVKGKVAYSFADGVLTISGKGDMQNYQNFDPDEVGISSPFFQNPRIKEVVIEEGVTNIGSAAFASCYNLKSITIPKSVNYIGDYAFYECYKLKSIVIPDSITKIGEWAFGECQILSSVTLPKNLKEIEGATFYHTAIKTIAIPDGCESIRGKAFAYCGKLLSASIPVSVKTIGEESFYESDLIDVYYFGTKTQWNKIKIAERNYVLRKADRHYVKDITGTKLSKVKVTADKKQFKLSWGKRSGVTGYQIQYATDSKFKKNKKSLTVKGAGKTSKTVKNLNAKKKYYVRIRAYKSVCGKKYYSKWTSKKVTTK